MKEHFDHQKAETQREQMRNEIDRTKRLLENNDTVVHKQVWCRQNKKTHGLAGLASSGRNTTPCVYVCMQYVGARGGGGINHHHPQPSQYTPDPPPTLTFPAACLSGLTVLYKQINI